MGMPPPPLKKQKQKKQKKTETSLLVQICGLLHFVFLSGLFIACNLVSLPTFESWRLFVFLILKYCFEEKIKTALLEPFSKAKVFARRHACAFVINKYAFSFEIYERFIFIGRLFLRNRGGLLTRKTSLFHFEIGFSIQSAKHDITSNQYILWKENLHRNIANVRLLLSPKMIPNQGSTNCGILQSWNGEPGISLENIKNMKRWKPPTR